MTYLPESSAGSIARVGDSDASSSAFEPTTLDELLAAPPEQIAACDIARMNLLCATGLPGSEILDIDKCLRRLDFITGYIRKETERDLQRFRVNPQWIYKTDTPHSECHFRIAHVATAMQRDFKMHYDARFLRDPGNKSNVHWRHAFADSRAILIHGLLGEKRSGIFTPISIVAAAIGRRLGYPLHLACTPHYDWVRWNGQGERFNVEIHSGGCGIVLEDEKYRTWPKAMRPEEEQSGYFFKNLSATDELALCLFCRAWVLECNMQFNEALAAWAKCCLLAPKNPEYARRAKNAVAEAMFMHKRGRVMQWVGKRYLRHVEVIEGDPREVLPPKLAALAFAIFAHGDETEGRVGNAMQHYRIAHDIDPGNPDHELNINRIREEFNEQLAQSDFRTKEAVGRKVRRAESLSLEKSGRELTELLGAEGSADQPQPELERTSELLRRARSAQAWHHHGRGKSAMAIGRWPEAQAAFAQAIFGGDEKEKQIFVADLRAAISKEVKMIDAPNATWPVDEDADPRDHPLHKMPPSLVALIWHNRGRVLEGAGRFTEAAHAYREAARLLPVQSKIAEQADARAARGKALESIGRLAQAADAYTEAHKLMPSMVAYSEEVTRLRALVLNPQVTPSAVYSAGLAVASLSFYYHETTLSPPLARDMGALTDPKRQAR